MRVLFKFRDVAFAGVVSASLFLTSCGKPANEDVPQDSLVAVEDTDQEDFASALYDTYLNVHEKDGEMGAMFRTRDGVDFFRGREDIEKYLERLRDENTIDPDFCRVQILEYQKALDAVNAALEAQPNINPQTDPQVEPHQEKVDYYKQSLLGEWAFYKIGETDTGEPVAVFNYYTEGDDGAIVWRDDYEDSYTNTLNDRSLTGIKSRMEWIENNIYQYRLGLEALGVYQDPKLLQKSVMEHYTGKIIDFSGIETGENGVVVAMYSYVDFPPPPPSPSNFAPSLLIEPAPLLIERDPYEDFTFTADTLEYQIREQLWRLGEYQKALDAINAALEAQPNINPQTDPQVEPPEPGPAG